LGRVSTPHQQETNIEASYDYVTPMLKQIYDGPMEIKYLGEQGSGMLTERATIMEAVAELETGQWDLVIMEDISKAYRNARWQLAFIQDAVDLGVRVIAPGDGLDTFEENWEVVLGAAALRHSLHIPDTRRRVRRTASYAFQHGGMVQRVKFGYRKLTKEEAESGKFGPKGLRLAKLAKDTRTVHEMRRRLMETRQPIRVVEWLIESGIPPGPYVKNGLWTVPILKDLLCDPLLSGTRTYQRTRYEPIFRTGKHKRTRNNNPQTKHYPELAHMTRDEQDSMLRAVEWSLNLRLENPARPSRRRGVPRRRSLWPGQAGKCICSADMHLMGEYLRCENSTVRKQRRCWCNVQPRVSWARRRLAEWLSTFAAVSSARRAWLVDEIWTAFQRTHQRRMRLGDLYTQEIATLQAGAANLTKAIRQGGKIPELVKELKQITRRIKERQTRLTQIREANRQPECLQSKEHVAAQLEEALRVMMETSFDFAETLRRFFPTLIIQPVQALDTNQVRPRAKLRFAASKLPTSVRATEEQAGTAEDIELVLNLFESPDHIGVIPRYLAAKAKSDAEGRKLSLDRMAGVLGVNRMTVKRARDYIKRMEAAGTTDPYRELHDRPEQASRWKPRRKHE